MTPLELLLRAVAITGSREKLARWLTQNSKPVTARTLFNWAHHPSRIRFGSLLAMCELCGINISDISPED